MTVAPLPSPAPGLGQALRMGARAIWRLEHAFERARAANRPADDTRLRIFFILALFVCVFAALAYEATRAALFSPVGEDVYAAPPPLVVRADLTDRNGELLAADITHYGLYLDPKDVWDPDQTRAALLKAYPKLARERLDRALAGKRREYLAGGLDAAEREAIHDLGLPGVQFEEEARRDYPLGQTGAHLIGYADPSGKGLAGAERGLDGAIHAAAARSEPVALAMDLRVQSALDDELRRAVSTFSAVGGAGLVVDVQTGEILALSSWPAFDPNAPGAAPQNLVANRPYELGSVFKVFTLAVALDQGLATLDSTFDVRMPLQIGDARPIHDHEKGDTVLTLAQVFTHSSNIGAAKLALRAGPAVMGDYFHRLGLFGAAPSELAESARPLVPRQLSELTLANIAFGQGISVTPLALATGMTAVLNGGRYIPLTIRKLGPGQAPQGRRVISEATSRTMLDLMRRNVVEGSGKQVEKLAPGLRVGGKTGSAQKVENGRYGANNVSSFAAVFPTDGPADAKRYFVLITLDSPKATKDTYGFITAGWNAAPTAGRVIDRVAPFLGVARRAGPALDAAPAASPAGTGMHD